MWLLLLRGRCPGLGGLGVLTQPSLTGAARDHRGGASSLLQGHHKVTARTGAPADAPSVMRPLWPPLQIPREGVRREEPFSGEAVGSGLHPWSFSREHSPNLPDGCFFLRHPRRGEGAHGGDKSISLLDSWGPPLGALQSSGVFVPEKQGSLCLLASPSDAKSSHTSRSGL